MTVRCRQCGQSYPLPANHRGVEARCPACGAMTLLRPPTESTRPPLRAEAATPREPREPRRSGHARYRFQRIFDPVPRSFALVLGGLLLIALLAPFWISLINQRPNPAFALVEDDGPPRALPAPTTSTTRTTSADAGGRLPVAHFLDQYGDVRLEMNRESLALRYTLRLKNTRGMLPEIYEAEQQHGLSRLTAYFYNSLLKEFTATLDERRETPAKVLADLRQRYGEPNGWSEDPAGSAAPLGTGIGLNDPLMVRLARFPHRRRLEWTSDEYRVDATIYYASDSPIENTTVLVIHVADSRWLESNRPLQSGTNQPAAGNAAVAPPVRP